MKFKVTTKLRDGIKDIEGETIEQKLNQDDWHVKDIKVGQVFYFCLLYTSPSPRDRTRSRMPSSA